MRRTISLRINGDMRWLIDKTSAVVEETRTGFVVEIARRKLIDLPLDQRLSGVDPEPHDAFAQALDAPPAPGPKLRALLRRVPAWER